MKCERCGTDYPSIYHFKAEKICSKCFNALSPAEREAEMRRVLTKHRLTSTTFDLDGYRVKKQLGVVRGITVRSRSIFGTVGASLQTLIGGNITLFTDLCEKSRAEAFEMMVSNAEQIGANAVIGVRYDTTEMMDGVTEVLCYGTAVVVEPISGRDGVDG